MRVLVPAAAFVATAVLVDAGALTWLDQYAVDHWMPWLAPQHHPLIVPERLFLPRASVLDVWTYPASLFVSLVVVCACTYLTGRLVFLALWLAVNAVELAGKLIVGRPPLYTAAHVHVTAFDHSLPSGHTMRAFVVAIALAWSFRRGRLAYLWAASVPVALVLTGDHVPTDVIAGLFAVAALFAAVRRR
jgi:membrane-associated phospholipid phosphatase